MSVATCHCGQGCFAIGRVGDSSGCVGFTLQFAPTVIIPEPNQITVPIGYLSWDADLVAVEVVGLLAAFSAFSCQVLDLRQGVVAVVL